MWNISNMEIILTSQNCIHKEIKSRINARNDCYLTVQNLLSSNSLSKDIKFKIYRTINLSALLNVCESWSFF